MEKYINTVLNHKLPSWNELPDFELYMDQVISLMQKYLSAYILPEDTLTPSMINNYVKMEILPAPKKKRYNKEHLAKLIVICLMKRQLSLPTINAIITSKTHEIGLEVFYNSFLEEYEKSIHQAVHNAKEEPSLLNVALSLAVNAAANHTVASNAVLLAFPSENAAEKPKKDKKEKKDKKQG